MHAKAGLRVLIDNWITRPGSVIADVMPLKENVTTNQPLASRLRILDSRHRYG